MQGGRYLAVGLAGAASPTFDDVCNVFAEDFLEQAEQTYSDFDVQGYLDQNCGGSYGGCNDPLLDVTQQCGVFEACPTSPNGCLGNLMGCITEMTGNPNGISARDIYLAYDYIRVGYNQGQWTHNISSPYPPVDISLP